MSGYGGYYPQDNDQNVQGQYNPTRQSSNTQGLANPNGRTNQYGQNGYSWSGQNQNEYSNNNVATQSYGQGSWRNNQDSTAFDYSRQSTYSAPASSAPQSVAYYPPATQASSQVNAPALNSLAYASGLESAGLQGGNRGSQNKTPVNTRFLNAQKSTVPQQRVNSPAQTSQHNHSRSINSATTDYRNQQTSADHVASSATALTAAANRYQAQNSTNTQRSKTPSNPQQTNTYPNTMGNTSFNAASVNTEPARSSSPYLSRSGATQGGRSHAPTVSAPATEPPTSYNKVTPSEIHRRANAAIFDGTTRDQSMEQTQVTANSAMPSCIDPSEVFDPYHYELERRRREEAAQAGIQALNPPEIEAPTETSAPPAPEQNEVAEPAAVTKPKKLRKAREKKSRQSEPGPSATSASQSEVTLSTPQPAKASEDRSEEQMANEMRSMIEKMREWISKDPRMFQSLWEDMKKGPATTASPTPTKASQGIPGSSKTTTSKTTKQTKKSTVPPAAASTTTPVVATAPSSSQPDSKEGPIKFSTQPLNVPTPIGNMLDGSISPTKSSKVPPQIDAAHSSANTSAKITRKDASAAHTMPVNQPTPSIRSGSGTVWPEAKRKSLADAAAAALSKEPANAGKNVTSQMVQDLLAENPSYLELCVKLESRGLALNRGSFARFLLNSVPDLTSSMGQQAPMSPVPHVVQTPIPPTVRQQSVQSTGTSVPQVSKTPPVKSALPQKTAKKSAFPEPPPGSKAAAARKRNFSDIVDLSQLSDGDDDPMLKQPRIASEVPEEPQPMFAPQSRPLTGFGSLSYFDNTQLFSGPSASPYARPNSMGTAHPAHPSDSAQMLAFQQNSSKKPHGYVSVVKALDKKAPLHRKFYNPKTIARDILVASGRHPSELALNHHMLPVMLRVPSLAATIPADLGTFDWDAIDPGGPLPPVVEEVEMDALPPRFALGQGKSRGQGQNSAKMPQGGQRGAVAISKNKGDANSILSTQFAQPSPLLSNPERPKKPGLPSNLRDVIFAQYYGTDTSGATPVSPQPSQLDKSGSPHSSMTSGITSSGKRRGRPPGAKKFTAVDPHSAPHSAVRAEEPPIPYPTFRCHWRGCKNELHNLETLRKHVSKVHKPKEPEEKFACWWKHCPLLRKIQTGDYRPGQFDAQQEWLNHLESVHFGPLALEFGDGPSDRHVGKTKTNANLQRFAFNPNMAPVKAQPYPSTKAQSSLTTDPGILQQQRQQFTSDPVTGQQVTPFASYSATPEGPLDAMPLPIEASTYNSYLKTHSGDKGKGKRAGAEEMLRAVQTRKARVGPGLDRGGATLVTQEMQNTLKENENIARVVEDDEDSDDEGQV